MNTLAIDAMGGDNAPSIIISGANIALNSITSNFIFFGDEALIAKELNQYPRLKKVSNIIHAADVIPGDMKPTRALRIARTSSLGMAIQCVKDGKANAVISAGNTGAYMALSKIILGMIPGILRPAIPAVMPTRTGHSVVLDLGANIDCSSDILAQFARMGIAFASNTLLIKNPTIGLLNIGTESLKGPIVLQETHELLSDLPNYIGFVEDIMLGNADVVVTDGFTGNIALKAIEGTAKLLKEIMQAEIKKSLLGKLSYLIGFNTFKRLKKRLDPRRYNGAVFLGLQHLAIKSHGGADAFGFSCAIQSAHKMQNLCPEIAQHF